MTPSREQREGDENENAVMSSFIDSATRDPVYGIKPSDRKKGFYFCLLIIASMMLIGATSIADVVLKARPTAQVYF